MNKSRQKQKLSTHRPVAIFLAALIFSIWPTSAALAAAPNMPMRSLVLEQSPSSIKRPSVSELTKPVQRKLSFSTNPSDLEIFDSRVFSQPLIPMDDKSSISENCSLAKALVAFKMRSDPEGISQLITFLHANPTSRWRPALEVNLGQLCVETGYLSDALTYWESAWQESKAHLKGPRKTVADEAISNLVLLEARLGLTDSLERHLSEIHGRGLGGSAEKRVKDASDGLWTMKHHPEIAFKCGPFAINNLARVSIGAAAECGEMMRKVASTDHGTNLAQLEDWSRDVGLHLQMAKRSGGSLIVPSLMHWAIGHFAAIVKREGDRYQVQDPTFGEQNNFWLSKKALESQTDGYFLVPDGPLPTGWQEIERKEAEAVWGKGDAMSADGSLTGYCPHECPGPPCCDPPPQLAPDYLSAMAKASAFSLNATLNIVDYPLGYKPPVGPNIVIAANYNFNEGNQPATFTFTNLGSDWSLNWVSYLTIDASQNITVRVRGGGYELYNYSSGYTPNLTSQAQIVNLGGGSYQRKLVDGTIENFTLSDGTNTYMTSVQDPQGNAATISYDTSHYRVTGVTDAAGNPQTTFSYVSNTFGNVGYYKVASITDGFGRSCSFAYDSTTTYLTSITDAAGNVSQFVYDPSGSSFITMMTTPYGSTSFYKYTPQGGGPQAPPVGLRFTFPDGSTAVIENWLREQRQTYFWDREATSLYPFDPANRNYTHCKSTKWLFLGSTNAEAPVIYWTRPALEAPIVYSYPGQPYPNWSGTIDKPTQIARQVVGFQATATVGGTVTVGDVLGIKFSDQLLPGAVETATYTVKSGDTLSSIASGLAAAINADSYLVSVR